MCTINKLVVSLVLCFVSAVACASACQDKYPDSKPVVIPNTGEVCKSFFVVVYDAKMHRPLFSSQKFQPHDHSMVKRVGHFYNNPLNDIDTNSYPDGYDRGHLTPAADSINATQMHDTFDIINSAPQVSTFNRGQWKDLEEHVRKDLNVSTWIVTGLVWGDNDRIPVAYYKVVYAPQLTAYIGNNTQHGDVSIIDIDVLENMIGYKLH